MGKGNSKHNISGLSQSEKLLIGIQKPTNWWEKYCSHVLEPGQYVAVFVALFLLLLGLVGLLVYDSIPYTIDNTEELLLSFDYYENDEDNGYLYLFGDSEIPCVLDHNDATQDKMRKLCDGKNEFLVYVRQRKIENSPVFEIAAIYENGDQEILSLDEKNSYDRSEQMMFWVVVLVGIVFMLGFMVLFFKVGCEPERYSKKLVYALYKESAIFF